MATKTARTKTARTRAVDPNSNYQQALAYARRYHNIQRPKLVAWLQETLGMTPAGSNTYATAVLREAQELRVKKAKAAKKAAKKASA